MSAAQPATKTGTGLASAIFFEALVALSLQTYAEANGRRCPTSATIAGGTTLTSSSTEDTQKLSILK